VPELDYLMERLFAAQEVTNVVPRCDAKHNVYIGKPEVSVDDKDAHAKPAHSHRKVNGYARLPDPAFAARY
jgi:hypothetical protein